MNFIRKNIGFKMFVCMIIYFMFINIVFAKDDLNTSISIVRIRIENMVDPVGIDIANPEFSWQIVSGQRGTNQSAYQLIVASSSEQLEKNIGDYWDTKQVASNEQLGIVYDGRKLATDKEYYWKVRIWDEKGNMTGWSKPGKWITGIFDDAGWKAKWITYDPQQAASQPFFKKSFDLQKRVKAAVVHISGLGYYELYLNGKKIGDHVLDPGQTNYDDYALYASYDVTSMLLSKNAIGVMLGNGWYNQDIVWGNMSYGKPLLICQLNIEYDDGTTDRIVSDGTWKWANGPVINSNVYAGEVYDARKEIPNWASPADTFKSWIPVSMAEKYPPKLKAQLLPPIKEMEEIQVKHFYKIDHNTYIFDLGRNFAGYNKLKIENYPEGSVLKIRMGEEVDSNGELNTATTGVNATKVEQIDQYTCKGTGTEIWQPRFTYHGFRYVEISGLTKKPNADLLTGIAVYSSDTKVGTFECSDPQINHLHEISVHTMTSNLHSIPTDCPTREKCGWLGDAHAIAETSIFNYDMEQFWIKYLYDIRSSSRTSMEIQFHVASNHKFRKGIKDAGIPVMVSPGKRLCGAASIEWGSAEDIIPWYVYVYYGNKNLLKEFYPDMKKWAEYAQALEKDNIVYEGLGDWCPPGGKIDCPIEITSTAFYYYDLDIMQQAAAALGKTEDMNRFRMLKDAVGKAFIDKFLIHNSFGSQTADAIALDFGLVPAGMEEKISDDIAENIHEKYDNFMHAGIFGLKRLFNGLSAYGNPDMAYKVLTKKGNNSFERMWNVYDATTFWEVLPVSDKYKNNPNISHNHPMQAGFDAWFYQGILGIRPSAEQPGFKKMLLSPQLTDQLDWAKGSYESVYGLIESNWKSTNRIFLWDVTIPPNTSAVISIPAHSKDDISEGGKAISEIKEIKFLKMDNNMAVFEITSGKYSFSSKSG